MSMGVKSMDLESLVGNVVQTTSNVGGDVGLALPIIINDAPFRGLTAGPNVVLTVLGDSSVEIASIDTSQSPLTTKGDIWGYSGIDARIPVGANTLVLTANSGVPLGVEYTTKEFFGPMTATHDYGSQAITNLDYLASDSATVPAAGFLRLGNDDTFVIRSFADNFNFTLGVDVDGLVWNIPDNADAYKWKIGGNEEMELSVNQLQMHSSFISQIGYLASSGIGGIANAGWIRIGQFDEFSWKNVAQDNNNGLDFIGDIFKIKFDAVAGYSFSATQADFKNNKLFNVNPTTITDFTTVTAEAGDFVWIIDSTDGLSKKSNISDFLNDNTVSNVGTGVDVFKQQTGIDFEFRTLLANTEILIAENSLDLAFSIGAIAISKITNLQTELDTKFDTIVNVGIGTGLIFRDKVGQTANLKTIIGGSNITVTNNADDITISSPPDTQVTASNVGTGVGVFKQKVLSDLEFKSLLANTEILIANNVDDLAFSIGAIAISKITNLQTELDSKIETITNVGAGVGIANAKVGQNVDLQSLVAGTDISVISNGTEITIANTRTPTSASNLGAGEGVFAQKVLEDLEFKSFADTTEILVSSTATEISMLVGAIAISQVTGLQTALDSLTSGSRKIFKEKRQISVYFGNKNNIESIMFGAGDLTTLGADTPFLDADGHYNELSANVGMAGVEDGGFFCLDVVRRDLNFDIQIKFRLTQNATQRLWLGFFTADPIALDNPITEHIALRLSTVASNVNFVISHADGVTQAETQLGVADLLIHTIRIVSDEANSKFQYSFDGGALTDLTTNIPAATTNLDSYNEIRSLVGGTVEAFDFWYLDGEADA